MVTMAWQELLMTTATQPQAVLQGYVPLEQNSCYKLLGKQKKAALALQYLPLPFSLSYGTQAVYQFFFSGCSFDYL